jgi:hypothetical protein
MAGTGDDPRITPGRARLAATGGVVFPPAGEDLAQATSKASGFTCWNRPVARSLSITV